MIGELETFTKEFHSEDDEGVLEIFEIMILVLQHRKLATERRRFTRDDGRTEICVVLEDRWD